jgi:hypothetical protein
VVPEAANVTQKLASFSWRVSRHFHLLVTCPSQMACAFSAALARVLLLVFSVGPLVFEHLDHALLASDSLRYI